eukprot:1478044-Pleurochrysis_carterae.AAC.1
MHARYSADAQPLNCPFFLSPVDQLTHGFGYGYATLRVHRGTVGIPEGSMYKSELNRSSILYTEARSGRPIPPFLLSISTQGRSYGMISRNSQNDFGALLSMLVAWFTARVLTYGYPSILISHLDTRTEVPTGSSRKVGDSASLVRTLCNSQAERLGVQPGRYSCEGGGNL